MTEQSPLYDSALTRVLDVEETELGAIRTRQPVTMEDYRQAQVELYQLRQVSFWTNRFVDFIAGRDWTKVCIDDPYRQMASEFREELRGQRAAIPLPWLK